MVTVKDKAMIKDVPNFLIKIADFHNVSVDFLLGRTDNPKLNK